MTHQDGDIIEQCTACDGQGMGLGPARYLFICTRCDGSGYVPHACPGTSGIEGVDMGLDMEDPMRTRTQTAPPHPGSSPAQ